MDNEQYAKQPKLGNKLLVLGLLILVLWASTMFVWGVVQEREQRREGVLTEVKDQWGRAQVIAGPILTVPVEWTNVLPTGGSVITTDTLTILPKGLSYESTLTSEMRTRGIYEVPVYTTSVRGSGTFNLDGLETQSMFKDAVILWDRATLSMSITDTRGITSSVKVGWNGKDIQWSPASQFKLLGEQGIHASVPVDVQEKQYSFTFEIPIRGTETISFLPMGEDTNVRIQSDWNAPNFIGNFLPGERAINDAGFSAEWHISSLGKNIPQYWVGSSAQVSEETLLSEAFGVGLHDAVDLYTMIDRATKYSILFISLTFLIFFMYEVLAGLRIHPMQYLLVGLAIALFYLLLLSLAEVIGFLKAYIVSVLAITGLITGYCISVLKVRKRAFWVTALLALLYGYLYILLQLEEFALLFGSFFLLVVLAVVMYLTRHFDWYELKKE